MPSPFSAGRLILPALLALLGSLGCVDHNHGTPLYVWDGSSSAVLEWNDVNNVYTASGGVAPKPDNTITSSGLLGGLTLGWGGMTMNTGNNSLYLVSESGLVVVIPNVSNQSGELTGNSTTTNIYSFQLGAAGTDQFSSGSVFGQAGIDTSTGSLYVMETSKDGTANRVWAVASSLQAPGNTLTPATSYTSSVSGDSLGCGLAVGTNSNVFGLFGGNNNGIVDPSNTTIYGARLRLGVGNSFPASSNVIIGADTGLNTPSSWSSLAYDVQNSVLYVLPEPNSTSTDPAVLRFGYGQFANGFDQTPNGTLSDTQATLQDTRILAHPTGSDWLLGADFTLDTSTVFQGTGMSFIRIWKNPSGGGSMTKVTLATASSAAVEVRGMAMGQSN